MTAKEPVILVLGAGVVGLSTAICCQDRWPQARVSIVADKYGDGTTSWGAGGIFRPTRSKLPDIPIHILRQWLTDSWRHYDKLAHSADASLAGTQVVSGYQFFETLAENTLEKDFVYHYRPLTEKEMTIYPGMGQARHGFFVTTLMTEGYLYLQYLMKRFTDNGGKCIKQRVESLNQFVGHYDLVFNCIGLGSKTLLDDKELVPIRGQLLKIKAPWVKHTFLHGDNQMCFIYPGREYCSVGVTRQYNDNDLSIRQEDTQTMWHRACTILPSLQKAEIVSSWVGLRPHRNVVRVEKQVMTFPNGSLNVIHNYGHGAEGISLSWGTSLHAVRLARDIIEAPFRVAAKL